MPLHPRWVPKAVGAESLFESKVDDLIVITLRDSPFALDLVHRFAHMGQLWSIEAAEYSDRIGWITGEDSRCAVDASL